MEANDPKAFIQIGRNYHGRLHGLPQDSNRAIELWSKAAEPGWMAGYSKLGNAYECMDGVLKKI